MRQSGNSSHPEGNSSINYSAWRWPHKILAFAVFSVVINHISQPDSFPGSESYRFPTWGVLSSMVLCIAIAIIAEVNFRFFKRKYFSKKVETTSIVTYLLTTLGYVTIMYIPLNLGLNYFAGGQSQFYYLLIGLLVTLLLSLVIIASFYAYDVYHLYQTSLHDAEITIERGAKINKLTYEDIGCFYVENKIVYTVKKDGNTISTDFTLNDLEENLNDQLFFRANRQVIIHKEAVDEIEKIENGKLLIRLKPELQKKAIAEIVISRYKRKDFLSWQQ